MQIGNRSLHFSLGRQISVARWSSAQAFLSARELESCRQSCEQDIELSSLLLITYESLRRAGGRNKPLIDCHADEMISAPMRLHKMACCLLITDINDCVTYLNQAAQEHLLRDHQGIASFTSIEDPTFTSPSDDNLSNEMKAFTDKMPLASILSSPSEIGLTVTRNETPIHVRKDVSLRSLIPSSSVGGGRRSYICKSLLSCHVVSPSSKIMGQALVWDEWTCGVNGVHVIGRPLSPPIYIHKTSSSAEGQGQCTCERYRASLEEVEAAQAIADNQVRDLSDEVRSLKLSGADKDKVDETVRRLQAAKKRADDVTKLSRSYGPLYQSLIDTYLAS